MKRIIVALSFALALAGCVTNPSIVVDPAERALPLELLKECADLSVLTNGSPDEIWNWATKTAKDYGACADGKHALIEWIMLGRKK